MAGIFGIFDPALNAEQLRTLADRMCRALTHEPWYQSTVTVGPPLAAGRVSLGIFNPQPQPGCNEDGSVQVWFEGEIFAPQRQALRQRLLHAGRHLRSESDAELLAHAYTESGADCLRDLEAAFAVALYDRRDRKVLLAVDRYATRPLHYWASAGRLLFASEIKAILQDERVPRQTDEQGWAEFFTFRHPLADRTFFRDVRFLPAGHLVVFEAGRAQATSYWAPSIAEDPQPRSRAVYLEEATAALDRAFQRQLSDDRSVGLFLSGGLDSRQLAGSMPTRGDRFHTFSRGPAESWDVRLGKLVADKVGSRHHQLDLQPDFLPRLAKRGVWLTDGLMTVLDIYILSVIQAVQEHVQVAIFGMGAGAHILSGIALSKALLRARTLAEAAQVFLASEGRYLPLNLQARLLPPRFSGELRDSVVDTLQGMLAAYPSETPAGQVESLCVQCRWPRSSGYGPLLARTQVETRSPYSDADFLAAVARIPARWRMKRQMQIALLAHTRPDLASIPWEFTGLPAVASTPTRIFIQRGLYFAQRQASKWSSGLIPAGTERERANYPVWFRTVLRPWLESILLDKRTLERSYYQPAALRQMIAEHMAGRQNYATEFGLLLTFELWNRLFVDNEPVEA